MKQGNPLKLIGFGLVLLLVGVILPFLMVIRLLEPNFLLSLLAYASSLIGLIMGFSGIAQFVRPRRGD